MLKAVEVNNQEGQLVYMRKHHVRKEKKPRMCTSCAYNTIRNLTLTSDWTHGQMTLYIL